MPYAFLQDIYANLYRNESNAVIFLYAFAFNSIAMTLTGLLFIMSFIVKCRTKEICIRKVNGASRRDIVVLLNRNIMVWMLVAFVIAIPVSYIILSEWLKHFAHKIVATSSLFILSGLLVLVMTIFTVSFQSLRAASIDPVDSL
jgi:putative ABC transport system permease protein